MSRDNQEKPADRRGELARELRQFHGLGASFFRAAAASIGMTVTDMQVIDLLESAGPATAGQLADLTGLTTGAITGMLNRLEETGIVHRERDPNDGRRVIVRLASNKSEDRKVGPLFASLDQAWGTLTSDYDEEQIAFLLNFLKRSNALARSEIVQLREAPESDEGISSAPLGRIESGKLVVSSGLSRLNIRAAGNTDNLYQARFEGRMPDVKVKEGAVTIRYPRRLLALSSKQEAAEVELNANIPWRVAIQGGGLEVDAELDGLNLAGVDVKGGYSIIRLKLPVPTSVVPVRFTGGASEIDIQRPAGVSARAHLKGWVSAFYFDDQTFSDIGNNIHLQSPGYEPAGPYYDIEVASSASSVTITSR
ncbi:MarR family winged helix-turn-helix transcriptional regulator [Ktedonospora formicarum]|uniref:HTH marR-type domain-containing protein n=1 Tax=Ktedonospora formicarum TaxID=2778364 RepID=A0A8J3MTB2_9CHLR|nr:MarR family transcriptional regulator [Ktedonospora formicarum]GHO48042.1 hypothetical protein KSX_62050 [Ktedonospora formicarum]